MPRNLIHLWAQHIHFRWCLVYPFSISRPLGGQGVIRISHQSAFCKPMVDQDLKFSLLFTVHSMHAFMLFRKPIVEIQWRILSKEE